MKKQNMNNRLAFNKAAVIELNENSLIEIYGGSTIVGGETCSGCMCDPITIRITIYEVAF
ncbi:MULTISPECIES: class I lanthipeptide [unclassified Flavobacterium]|uniref:class I lanthipeptide n=1 Tax=unclassified Flavobacterium TaxID=196869 RepID=UPI00360A6F57